MPSLFCSVKTAQRKHGEMAQRGRNGLICWRSVQWFFRKKSAKI
nr:MAG TPA: hypothetical protein [Caudoviricetes sp.]